MTKNQYFRFSVVIVVISGTVVSLYVDKDPAVIANIYRISPSYALRTLRLWIFPDGWLIETSLSLTKPKPVFNAVTILSKPSRREKYIYADFLLKIIQLELFLSFLPIFNSFLSRGDF